MNTIMIRTVTFMSLVLLLTGCGLKGDLYIEDRSEAATEVSLDESSADAAGSLPAETSAEK
jgi:predicted small lipoprotein YifL